MAQVPKGVSPGPIFGQMKKLEEAKEVARAELADLQGATDEGGLPVALSTYEEYARRLRDSLALAGESLKGKIIRRVIHEVEVLAESIRVWYKVEGQEILPYLEAEDGAAAAAVDGSEKAQKIPAFSQVFFKNRGSTTLQNGVGEGN